MPAILVVALAVFFIWEAVLRTLISYATDRAPALVDNVVKSAVVLLTVWLVDSYVHGQWLFMLGAGGLVALLSAGLRRLTDTPDLPAPVRRPRGVPQPGA
jgi:hypothetical protein